MNAFAALGKNNEVHRGKTGRSGKGGPKICFLESGVNWTRGNEGNKKKERLGENTMLWGPKGSRDGAATGRKLQITAGGSLRREKIRDTPAKKREQGVRC